MGVSRRGFLKIVAGAGTGIMFTPLPWKLLDDISIWTQNWSWIPSNIKGPNSFVPVVSKTCPSAVATMTRLVGDNPVRLLPDGNHPLGGGLTALAAAEVEMLHSPSRVMKPLKRARDGGFTETTWEEAAQLFFEAVKKAGNRTAFVTGDETGTTSEMISAFASAIGSDDVFFMPSEAGAAAAAARLMGIEGQLGYDIENSDFVLAIGANILETWGPVVATRKAFFKKRPHPGQEGQAGIELAYASPLQDNTASAAKIWLPILPGTEEALALGIASELINRGRRVDSRDFAAFSQLCAGFTLEKTAEICGVSAEAIKEVVDALASAQAPLVIAGSNGAGAAPVIAAMGVNALLGNINRKGGVTVLPDAPVAINGAKTRRQIHARDFTRWLFEQNGTEVLVVNEANPAFALAGGKKVADALARIPFKVAFTAYRTETAEMCDLVLPIGSGLERYDDVSNPYGYAKNIYCITRPVVQRGEYARHTGDVLLLMAKNLGKNLDFARAEDVFRKKVSVMRGNMDDLAEGRPMVSDATVAVYGVALRPDVLEKALNAPSGDGQLRLAVSTRLAFGTADTGIPPFNTKTIRANELKGTEMYVAMNGATAAKYGLVEMDRVKLASQNGAITALVHIFEGVRADTVAASFGFGHTAFDVFSKNKGANVMEIIEAAAEPQTGLAVWSTTSVNVTKA